MAPQAAVVSYRLGGNDGVSVEARKWAWALGELGFEVRRVAGAIEDGGRADDVVVPGLTIAPAASPDPNLLAGAIAGADLVIVDNIASLPAEPAKRRTRCRVPSTRHRRGFCSVTTICRGSAAIWRIWRPTSRRGFPVRCT